jgi:hypothetical protein
MLEQLKLLLLLRPERRLLRCQDAGAVAHRWHTQVEFTLAAGMRASTAGGIGVRTHQHSVTARLLAIAQSLGPAQRGQDASRSGMAPILPEGAGGMRGGCASGLRAGIF